MSDTSRGPEPVVEELQALSSSQLDALREKARTDLFFLAKGILGYKQVNAETHGGLCSFMVREPSKRRLVLMPRGHLKTTICTIADSIRKALCAPNETRILIQNEAAQNASDILGELKAHWTNDGLLPHLFPELVPERTAGAGSDWSSISASVNRRAVFKESTWSASGSGGSPQSKHFTDLKCDDLIGERHKGSTVEMERAIRWADSMEPLLDSLDDQIDFYGTRKTMSDVYQHVMDKYAGEIAVFIREPIENGKPIFWKYPLRRLLQIMQNTPEVWAHDFMNNPIGKGGIDWGPDYTKFFSLIDARRTVQLQHHITGKLVEYRLDELDIVVTVDPNSGKKLAPNKAAVIVHGVTPDDGICILDVASERWSPDELIDHAFQACRKWHPRVVGIEDAGPNSTIYYFEKRCMEAQQYFRIQPLKHPNTTTKERRIRSALDTPLKSGRLYLQRSHLSLASAISFFPQLAAHAWDEIDCLAFGPEIYRTGISQEELDAAEDAETKILQFRGVTGYGQSV